MNCFNCKKRIGQAVTFKEFVIPKAIDPEDDIYCLPCANKIGDRYYEKVRAS